MILEIRENNLDNKIMINILQAIISISTEYQYYIITRLI